MSPDESVPDVWVRLPADQVHRLWWIDVDPDTVEKVPAQSVGPYLTVQDGYEQRARVGR